MIFTGLFTLNHLIKLLNRKLSIGFVVFGVNSERTVLYFKFSLKNACVKIGSPYNATPLRRQSRQRLARQAANQ
ncbi:hypothetical protein C7Y70_02910 [Pseudoalteromonas sp. KS88]|nr:hypothetical protein C7Y70_02910 [Pseudoalteromonas sp. KS88]